MCCVVQFLCMLQVFSLFVVIIVEVIAQKKELLHILHRALFLRVMHYGVIFIIQFMALPVELKHAVSSLTSNSINLQATAPHTNTSPCPNEGNVQSFFQLIRMKRRHTAKMKSSPQRIQSDRHCYYFRHMNQYKGRL